LPEFRVWRDRHLQQTANSDRKLIELRRSGCGAGSLFQSKSDTEVIVIDRDEPKDTVVLIG